MAMMMVMVAMGTGTQEESLVNFFTIRTGNRCGGSRIDGSNIGGSGGILRVRQGHSNGHQQHQL
jgi:hypothetical protein